MAAVDPNEEQVKNEDYYNYKSFISNYHKALEELCFTDCVHDFTTRKSSSVETTCASNCFQNYIDVSKRVDLKAIEWRKRQTDTESTDS
ncbi:mitochondrial import inner membrane translocase subunit Tim9-like [Argopecten irradians]|uniref:mitochondrial import inner membrane translocase subunit Tim9-like n=1 Tax=Argopecten irradians TaxID=31199 RepID=UPI00371726A4